MRKPHVAILGAGPAGLGAAYKLTQLGLAQVTILERNPFPGGNASSFEIDGVHVDFGSHRLHPASDPEILTDIRALLGDELKDQPRHGRILLRGRWIHFPLKPLDLALRLPPSFALGVGADVAGKMLRPGYVSENGQGENFASVLEAGLGKTICRDFYFPYARKLWGMAPEELSAIQARRRISAGSLTKMMRKIMKAVPGLKPAGSGRFFYPLRGFGQISEAYARAAREAGAEARYSTAVSAVEIRENAPHIVHYQQDGRAGTIEADYVWSTIPITILAKIVKPAPPAEYLEAASRIDYRAMILIYLVLPQAQFTEFDAHYFPGVEIPISRLSEPKNYSRVSTPTDRTVLCAELPCSADDPVWEDSDEQLGELVQQALANAGIPISMQPTRVLTKRLRQAYPIYLQGYETHFDRLDNWLSGVDRLLTFGRQGLFAHDNTHHALYMAYAAAKCFTTDGQFDRERWRGFRQIFETHVVED